MKNIKDNEKAMKYNDVVIDKTTGLVALKNVCADFDEEYNVYHVFDYLELDDGEIRVEIEFCLTEDAKPLGIVYNSYFAPRNRYDMLKSEVPIQEAYDDYKACLAQNIRLDMNLSYDNFNSYNNKFIALNVEKEKKRKKVK